MSGLDNSQELTEEASLEAEKNGKGTEDRTGTPSPSAEKIADQVEASTAAAIKEHSTGEGSTS